MLQILIKIILFTLKLEELQILLMANIKLLGEKMINQAIKHEIIENIGIIKELILQLTHYLLM